MRTLKQLFLRFDEEYSLVVKLQTLDDLFLGQARCLDEGLLAVNVDFIVLEVLRIVKVLGLGLHLREGRLCVQKRIGVEGDDFLVHLHDPMPNRFVIMSPRQLQVVIHDKSTLILSTLLPQLIDIKDKMIARKQILRLQIWYRGRQDILFLHLFEIV